MGNPDIYYKRVLQSFAYALAERDEDNNARRFLEEENISKLERYILKMKLQCKNKLFYYDAGRSVQQVLANAYLEGTDSLNASLGGLIEFEYFIGIIEDDED